MTELKRRAGQDAKERWIDETIVALIEAQRCLERFARLPGPTGAIAQAQDRIVRLKTEVELLRIAGRIDRYSPSPEWRKNCPWSED